MHAEPVEVPPSEAERIAYAYRIASDGDAWTALVRLAEDALTDQAKAERLLQLQEGMISRGYARAGVPRS